MVLVILEILALFFMMVWIFTSITFILEALSVNYILRFIIIVIAILYIITSGYSLLALGILSFVLFLMILFLRDIENMVYYF